MRIPLPYPPSINHYWRQAGRRVLISREGRAYREAVAEAVRSADGGSGEPFQPLTGRLAVRIEVYPPDARSRDLDNILKPLLDALQKAGVYRNDDQIDWLLTERAPVVTGGAAIVEIEDLNDGRFCRLMQRLWSAVIKRFPTTK